MAGGVFFMVLAFTIFLPLIIIAPAKFAFSFSVSGLLILSAFGALRGWQQQMQDMTSRERLPFSIGMHTVCRKWHIHHHVHVLRIRRERVCYAVRSAHHA